MKLSRESLNVNECMREGKKALFGELNFILLERFQLNCQNLSDNDELGREKLDEEEWKLQINF